MAKTARRSIASDPLPPKNSSDHNRASQQQHSTSSIPTDPLRLSAGSYYTTQTIPISINYTGSNHSQPFSSKQFHNVNTNSTSETFNSSTILDRVAAERARIRMEFFATYDVMTGVRIAATLGGFFGLMVFLVVYKSRGETQETLKALKDPKIAAVAAAVMQEEEDRELQEAMEATGMSIYPDEYDHIGFRRGRLMSVGNVSAPPVFNRGYRLSSLDASSGSGGYSSLIGPHRRFSYAGCGRKSSESSRVLSAYPMGGSFGIDDYFVETDGDEADDEFDQITTTSGDAEKAQTHLAVPPKGQESRRSSNITCCSSESSYLERRCSAITLGLTPLPPISSADPSRRQSTTDTWDYYYPGIHVTQPTPKTSPCPSEISINEKRKIGRHKSLIEQDSFDCISEYPDVTTTTTTTTNTANSNSNKKAAILQNNTPTTATTKLDGNNGIVDNSCNTKIIRRAPLASLSSFKVSSVDYQDSDLRSLGSDSVFADSYADTDDDMEQFSTDSDEISDAQSPQHTRTTITAQRSIIGSGCSTISADIELQPKNYSNSNSLSSKINNSITTTTTNTFETKAIIEKQHDVQQLNEQQQEQLLSIKPIHQTVSESSSLQSQFNESISSPSTIILQHQSTTNLVDCFSNNTTTTNNSSCSNISIINLSSNYNIINNKKTNSNQNINEINNRNTSTNNNNSKTSECVNDVNVVVVDNRSIVSPSVILELPVISTQEINEQPIDPSLPGPSRKWSKETLF